MFSIYLQHGVADWESFLSLLFIFLFFYTLFTFTFGEERIFKNEQKAHKRTPEGKRLFFIACKANIV